MATIDVTRADAGPPHNLEAEQSVLGAVLLSDKAMYGLAIEERLRPEHFFREAHRIVYQVMLDLYEDNVPVDSLTVTDRLRRGGQLDEIGGEGALHSLAGAVPSAGNARHYGRIVREQAMLRQLLSTTYDIQSNVRGSDLSARDLIERAEREIFEVAHGEGTKDFRSIEEVLNDEVDKLEKLSKEGTALTGTPSGFSDFDDITGGFQPGNLIIVAARPSMGKSALVADIAVNAALDHGRPVALFSLEMSESELAQRFVAARAKTKGDDLRKGRVTEREWPKVLEAASRLSQAPLWIDDSSDIGLLEIRAKARRMKTQKGLDLIIVDYLQLMHPDGRTDNRVEQIGQISRGLKIMARELEVPVIALSQLNRGVEQRTDKRPLLSDLRESGSIEQDADLVVFIYRDEYYHPDDTEHPGEAELIISKHRNGALGNVRLTFQSQYPRFMNFIDPDRLP